MTVSQNIALMSRCDPGWQANTCNICKVLQASRQYGQSHPIQLYNSTGQLKSWILLLDILRGKLNGMSKTPRTWVSNQWCQINRRGHCALMLTTWDMDTLASPWPLAENVPVCLQSCVHAPRDQDLLIVRKVLKISLYHCLRCLVLFISSSVQLECIKQY